MLVGLEVDFLEVSAKWTWAGAMAESGDSVKTLRGLNSSEADSIRSAAN